MRKVCRTLTLSLCAALLAVGTLTFADARSIGYDLNIPSEDLTAALQSFAIASHHKLLYKAELTAGKISHALKGHFTAQEAIEALLSGTGLSYEITGSSVVLIKDQSGDKTSDLRGEGTPTSPSAAHHQRNGQLHFTFSGGSRKIHERCSDRHVGPGNERQKKDDLEEIGL